MNAQVKFPSPYELKAPKGAEGWRDLYPYYALFQEERKKGDEKQFWFCDSQHWPTRVQAVRNHRRRVRGQVPGPVQHPAPADPAGQRHRVPDPPRLPLHEPDPGAARSRSRRACRMFEARGLTTSRTGTAARRTGTSRSGHHRRDGGALASRTAAGHGADRGHRVRQGDGRLRGSCWKATTA